MKHKTKRTRGEATFDHFTKYLCLLNAKNEKCADKFLLYAQFLPLHPAIWYQRNFSFGSECNQERWILHANANIKSASQNSQLTISTLFLSVRFSFHVLSSLICPFPVLSCSIFKYFILRLKMTISRCTFDLFFHAACSLI